MPWLDTPDQLCPLLHPPSRYAAELQSPHAAEPTRRRAHEPPSPRAAEPTRNYAACCALRALLCRAAVAPCRPVPVKVLMSERKALPLRLDGVPPRRRAAKPPSCRAAEPQSRRAAVPPCSRATVPPSHF